MALSLLVKRVYYPFLPVSEIIPYQLAAFFPESSAASGLAAFNPWSIKTATPSNA